MKERRYVRLKVDMHEDTKFKIIDKKPERDVIHYIWIRLIALAGKVNLDGDLYLSKNIPYTIKTLAIEFNRSEEQIKLALDTFIELEMVELKDNGIYRVINFAKHQNIKTKVQNGSSSNNNNNNNNGNSNSNSNSNSSATNNTVAKVNTNTEIKSSDNNDINSKTCNLKDVSNIKAQSEIINIDCNDSSSNNNSSIDKKTDTNPPISQIDVGQNISCNDNNAPIPLDIKKKKKKEDYCEIISLDEDSSVTSSSDGFFEGEVPLDKDAKIIAEFTF